MSKVPLILYHGPSCLDGMAAAWAAWKAFGEDAEYVVGKYQQDLELDYKERDVYFLDFSYKREQMLDVIYQADKVFILDHHKSAIEDLEGLDKLHSNFYMLCDVNHSGARLAYNYFLPHIRRPKLVDIIEDRDLWKFQLEETKEVTAALFSYDLNYRNIEEFMLYRPITMLRREGATLLRAHDKQVRLCASSSLRFVGIEEFGMIDIPFVNCPPNLTSDVGNLLALKYPFVILYNDTEEYRNCSMRSSAENPNYKDVSEFALLFGGGGHKHAAGFKVGRDHYIAQS